MPESTTLTYLESEEKSCDIGMQGETVLDAVMAQGIEIAHSCKAGLCQSCLLECREGEIPEQAQRGIKPSLKELGYFMACQCRPSNDMTVAPINAERARATAKVVEICRLNDQVIKLVLDADVSKKGGQYFTLWRDQQIGRSYSNAASAKAPFLEFHVKHLEQGQFSNWLASSVGVGSTLSIQGPMGECFYPHVQGHVAQGDSREESASNDPETLTKSMLLVGIGTGLAPLMGVIADALNAGHSGQIDLIIGGRSETSFYHLELLADLAEQHANLNVQWVCLRRESKGDIAHLEARVLPHIHEADIYEYTKSTYPDLAGVDVFLCGAESFVRKMKRQCFMAGAGMQDIHADSFIAAT